MYFNIYILKFHLSPPLSILNFLIFEKNLTLHKIRVIQGINNRKNSNKLNYYPHFWRGLNIYLPHYFFFL